MQLSAPKQITFLIALLLGLLGIIGKFVAIPFVSTYAFWFLVIAFLLLVIANLIEGF